jgi:glycosyltransferase involved in cell wall biosynthesis
VKTIALCMIVRNEAGIIERCLASVLPLIDYVLLVDTGSTDGTQSIARRYLEKAGIPGEVVDEPWRDFAYNRSFALARMREHAGIDYSFMIDADQVIIFDDGFDVKKFKSDLRHDLYDVAVSSGDVVYLQPQLASNKIEVWYRGVLHEFRECPESCSRGLAEGLQIREIHDSARGQDAMKYQKDAAVFEQALAVETDPFLSARYRFYLAQSYRDAGQPELAIENYLKRSELGFWDEEIFYSLYSVAKLKEVLNHPEEDIIETYLRAHRLCPTRVEAIHGAARFCRNKGRHDQGYQLSKKFLYQRCPPSGLFVETWIFDHGLLDEFSVLAFWSGRHAECLEACTRILAERKIPEKERGRIRQNAHFAIEKLGETQNEKSADESINPTISSFANLAAAISRPSVTTSRFAIVTPYYKEDRKTLERCLNSVRKQSVHVDHIVVADGFSQLWIDDEPVRHLKLDTAHANFGGTPRGLGLLLAVSEGYEGIGLLDADNWLAPDHVASCLELASQQADQCDFVVARRHLMTPDEIFLGGQDEPVETLVDTSCYFFLPGSYPALHHWVTMPKPLSPICDRIFLAATRTYKLQSVVLDQPTVFYETLWAAIYEAQGRPAPPNAKPNVDMAPAMGWLDSLAASELHLVNRLSGSVIRDPSSGGNDTNGPINRNARCPCGSGKRYKHCHGSALKLPG